LFAARHAGGAVQTLFVQIRELQQSLVTAQASVAARQVGAAVQTLFVQIKALQQSAVAAHAWVAARQVGPGSFPPPPPHPPTIRTAINTMRLPIEPPPLRDPGLIAIAFSGEAQRSVNL